MQPRSNPPGWSLRVTNAPDFSSNPLGISTGRRARLRTKASRASRAMRTAHSPSRSAYDIHLDETGKPMGIVTERDILTKVAAPDKQPSRVLVRDIMTSPVVVVHPHEEVAEAAKLMSQRKIRRLPVVQEGKLVGMITENDIIRVWPQLIEVTREYARAGLESQFAKGIEGHCEACGVYSTNLVWDRNLLVCPECRGG